MTLSWKDFEKKVEKLRVNYEKFVGEVVNNPNGTTLLSKEEQEVLAEYPFAPLIGVICDQQIKWEYACKIPRVFLNKIGSLEPDAILKVGVDGIREILKSYFDSGYGKFPRRMKNKDREKWLKNVSEWIIGALKYFKDKKTDPIKIFTKKEKYTAIEVYFTLRAINGIGTKKASMVVRDFIYCSKGLVKDNPWFNQIRKISPNFEVIDDSYTLVPVDVQVKKVFRRVFRNILNKEWEYDDIQLLARYIFPEFPAKIDSLFHSVGRKYCKDRKPNCSECPLGDICDYALSLTR